MACVQARSHGLGFIVLVTALIMASGLLQGERHATTVSGLQNIAR
jgi:hypothetical protein